MTKEQLSKLPDVARIPAELLFEHLKSSHFMPDNVFLTPEDGIVLLFSRIRENLTITADIEIDSAGTVTASIIPYANNTTGMMILEDPELLKLFPIDYWDIEEEPPFEESLHHIRQRFGLASQDNPVVPAI
tara:strand:+ start:3016 stop:3408 length:393 start_codon:yes stop_codon:yes gene_type:complete